MKANCILLVLFFIFLQSNAQNRAAYLGNYGDYYRCGNISVSGNQLTVEALIKMQGSGLFQQWSPDLGDIVSKHHDLTDANYLLRPDHCELTTTNGFYSTANGYPNFWKDSFYHVAMTYDGSYLRFYVNGCLFDQVAATGNLKTNNYLTTIGQLGSIPNLHTYDQFLGYLDEVRIWNVSRTQAQIVANMQDLPNFSSQTGLIAYYKFEGNSINVLGNSAYDALPFGTVSIQQQNGFLGINKFNAGYSIQTSCNNNGSISVNAYGGFPPYKYSINGGAFQSSGVFSSLPAGSYNVSVKSSGVGGCTKDTTILLSAQCASIGFTAPDTVCVNAPMNIVNNTTGASSYYWSFCSANLNSNPLGTNLGNPGNYLSQPVFVDLVEDNGNYYGFVVNHNPGGITRLDFGNSLLNTPTPVFLGNISGVMNANYGNEGIQIIKNNGKWYGILVGGSPSSMTTPRLITIYFGTNLNNPSPTAVNWGNIGNMLQPVDLHVFNENGRWYGLTVNCESNTITRFDFTNDLNNPPTGVNLGNVGNLGYPTGVFAMNDNGSWRVFVTNGSSSTVSRLDFGSSLLNTPTGINLGNPGNLLSTPRDISIIKYCGESVGFVTNVQNTITRLNFSSLTSTPTATSIGNIGNLSFPHSLSKLFRVGNDLYSLITNVNNNTITRLKFSGCTSSTLPGSTLQIPPAVSYNTPGIYNINLTIDDGLPTQESICKQVVVTSINHSPTKMYSICTGDSIKIGASIKNATYLWNNGLTTDSIMARIGTYWVESNKGGCTVRDSFIVSGTALCDTIKLTGPLKVCSASDTITYQVYKAPGCNQLFNLVTDNTKVRVISSDSTSIRVKFLQNGNTTIKVNYINNCRVVKDSLDIAIKFSPSSVILGTDLNTCKDSSLQLHAGPGFDSYIWQDGTTDSILTVRGPGNYNVVVQNFCGQLFKDTFLYTKVQPPAISVNPASINVCIGDSVQFRAAGGTSYSWQPSASFNNASIAAPIAIISSSALYNVHIIDNNCSRDTIIQIPVSATPTLKLSVAKTNDVSCTTDSAQLAVFGAGSYAWSPKLFVNDTTGNHITVRPPKTMTYYVTGRNGMGCEGKDSITVFFNNDIEQKLFMPSAFTPNRDGLNDIFRPRFFGPVTKYEFKLFNRWGELVFKSNVQGQGWDGNWKGMEAPGGVYIYMISCEGLCNGKFEQKGTFVLIR